VLTRDLGLSLAREAREVFFASVPVVDDVLARGGLIEIMEGLFAIDLRVSGSVGEFCVSCLAAAEAVVAVAAAGSLAGLVGDFGRTALGEVGVFSFLTGCVTCLWCIFGLGTVA
jgi:hypothetical protein